MIYFILLLGLKTATKQYMSRLTDLIGHLNDDVDWLDYATHIKWKWRLDGQ